MKISIVVPLLMAGMILAGCSSVPTRVNEGRIRAKTFNFMKPKGTEVAAESVNVAEAHAMIQKAITGSLAAKGVARVDDGGDIIVGYLLVIASNKAVMAIGDYFGYGAVPAELMEKAQDASMDIRDDPDKSRVRDPKTYKACALVVDVIDSGTLTLQYRNFAYRELLCNATMEVRAKRVGEVVDEIFRDLLIASPR